MLVIVYKALYILSSYTPLLRICTNVLVHVHVCSDNNISLPLNAHQKHTKISGVVHGRRRSLLSRIHARELNAGFILGDVVSHVYEFGINTTGRFEHANLCNSIAIFKTYIFIYM